MKQPGEILAELVVPPLDGTRVVHRKVRRRAAIDFPALGAAVAVRLAPHRTCLAARLVLGAVRLVLGAVRLVLGAVASAPRRCPDAEALLVGRRLTAGLVDEVAVAAATSAKPQDNTDFSHVYRKWVIPVHVARALQEVSADSPGSRGAPGGEKSTPAPPGPTPGAGAVRGATPVSCAGRGPGGAGRA